MFLLSSLNKTRGEKEVSPAQTNFSSVFSLVLNSFESVASINGLAGLGLSLGVDP